MYPAMRAAPPQIVMNAFVRAIVANAVLHYAMKPHVDWTKIDAIEPVHPIVVPMCGPSGRAIAAGILVAMVAAASTLLGASLGLQ